MWTEGAFQYYQFYNLLRAEKEPFSSFGRCDEHKISAEIDSKTAADGKNNTKLLQT